MKTPRKIYTATRANGTPIGFGNNNRIAYNSPMWILRHAKRSSYRNIEHVHEIDLANGTVNKLSAVEFNAKFGDTESYRKAIQEKFGLDMDLAGLVSAVKKNVFNADFNAAVIAHLKPLGIKF